MSDPKLAEQNRDLRRTLRDLVALSVMPAAWTGRDPQQIGEGLLDVLVSTLRLDVAYARLKQAEEENSVCLWRAERWPELPSWISAIEAEQGPFQRPSRFVVPIPVAGQGQQKLHLFVAPVGLHGMNGMVVAGCARADFPTETENLLLSVAANQAAIAFQSAQLLAKRNQAEEGAAQLAAIVESSDDAILSKDLEGRITSWNRGAERLYGYAAAEVVGRPVSILAPPESVDEIPGFMERLKRGERIEHFETQRIAKDGRRLTVTLSISPIRDKVGNIVGASAVARDITERKQAAQRKAAQHAITRILAEAATLAEAAPKVVKTICQLLNWEFGALWHVDHETRVLSCLDTCRLPGVSVPEFESATRQRTFPAGVGLPGRVWTSGAPAWIPDVTRDDNFPRARIAAKEGLHGAFGFPIVMGSETLGVMEFFSREVRQPDPDLLEMMATVGSQIGQFIERRRAELALQELEERFRRAQVAAGLGAYDWNLHTGEIKWSAQVPALRDIAPDGRFESWMGYVHPDDRENLQEGIARLMSEGGEWQAELRVIRP
ncbi:MAG TPA: PAS domain S-box protein, partial [Terriglobales bacterium]|nr:PAS domain S-box protein [Terriglobales bacterium]